MEDAHCRLNGKIALYDRPISDLAINTPTYTAGKRLISDYNGVATASTDSPIEFKHLTGVNFSLKEHINHTVLAYIQLNLDFVQVTNTHATNCLTKWWAKKRTPTGNQLYVNEAGNLDVPSTSLAHVARIQAQIDTI